MFRSGCADHHSSMAYSPFMFGVLWCGKVQPPTLADAGHQFPRRGSMQVVKNLGRRLLQLRLARRWTQEELEERTRIKQSQISKIERGLHNPKLHTVFALCRGLRAHHADVLRGIVRGQDLWVASAIPHRMEEEVTVKEAIISRYLSGRLKDLRKTHGIPQDQLAQRIGISLHTVQRMEGGGAMAHLSIVANVADFFGKELTDLLPPPGWELENGLPPPRMRSLRKAG